MIVVSYAESDIKRIARQQFRRLQAFRHAPAQRVEGNVAPPVGGLGPGSSGPSFLSTYLRSVGMALWSRCYRRRTQRFVVSISGTNAAASFSFTCLS
jgi:hypothetical protein